MSVLTDLRIGETATLIALDLPDSVQNYLMHMGFVPNALVTALRHAPAGDPTVYGIDGMHIALRRETARAIRVRTASENSFSEIDAEFQRIAATSQPPLSPIQNQDQDQEQGQSEIRELAGTAR